VVYLFCGFVVGWCLACVVACYLVGDIRDRLHELEQAEAVRNRKDFCEQLRVTAVEIRRGNLFN